MIKARTHYCPHCEWQQTLMLEDLERGMHVLFDHCPRCRSHGLLERQATRLETLATRVVPSDKIVTCRRHGKLPLKGLDSSYKWRQQSSLHFNMTGK
jgi:Zn-finger nucleic acid-binding protein